MTIDQAKQWTLPFGKYKGELIVDVNCIDEEYVEWLYDQLNNNDRLRLAIELACWTKEE